MELVVKGRHCEISDRFREHVAEKLSRVEKFDHRVIRIDVEVSPERNPRLGDRATRVELTLHSRGPVVRAEACAEDKLSALDKAIVRLEARLRRAADRRRVHHGSRTPTSLAEATATAPLPLSEIDASDGSDHGRTESGPVKVDGDGPLVVREKTHMAHPMTLEQALYEMELVGHDFYLFVDKASEQPSVVYRRRGYDYGVIHLAI
ncbi:MAG: ribosome hibernation-promoting factor, HPF/YfiA family [Nocardioidaceae bacterium]